VPVIFRKKVVPEPVPAPVAKPEPVEAPTPQAGVPERPKLAKTIHVGKSDILPDVDIHDVPGRTKFLIHIHKNEAGLPIWYRIMGYDENTLHMKLRSRHKNTFDAKMHPTVALHYMVVMQDEGSTEPTQEAFNEVKKLMATEPIKVAPGSFVGHASPAAAEEKKAPVKKVNRKK
jgi:hypothetical protein